MGKRNLGIFTCWEDINEELKVSTAFADNIISNWSYSQAETIIESIGENLIQKEIAIKFGKTQQAVNKNLTSAKDNLIKMYIKRFETIVISIDILLRLLVAHIIVADWHNLMTPLVVFFSQRGTVYYYTVFFILSVLRQEIALRSYCTPRNSYFTTRNKYLLTRNNYFLTRNNRI